MNIRPVLYVIGLLLSVLAISMTFPMLVDLHMGNPDWKVFFLCAVITSFFGGMLILTNTSKKISITIREGFLLTSLSWVILGTFAALPFWLSEFNLTLTDAIFEAISGITTTGATIIAGLDDAAPGLLLWRALLQWLGGIGIIVMAFSLLPFLNIGGMQLFRTESSENEKALPRAAQMASHISLIYVAFTILCTFAYILADFSTFDAICHAMTTISTGGFSNYDSSFMEFNRLDREIICMLFMLIGSIPFVLYLKYINGDKKSLLQNEQVRWFLVFLVTSIIGTSFWLVLFRDMPLGTALQQTSFNIISVVSTTGFASTDYSQWGLFPIMVFFFLLFIGGCNGSTSGGIKFFRFQIAYLVTYTQLKQLLSPNAVITPIYNGNPIPQDVPISVMSFFFLYASTFAFLALCLAFTGLDFTTATSASASAISNVGPGLGPIIGPAGNYASLSDTAKWLLSIGMILGRLELFTILVLFLPRFWRP